MAGLTKTGNNRWRFGTPDFEGEGLHEHIASRIPELVDIALKALSPGINDTTTAVPCVNYLTATLAELAARRGGASLWAAPGMLIIRGPDFAMLVTASFEQIRDPHRPMSQSCCVY
ncbi:MAG: DUF2254 domain-containing protein [Burkholderiales bacterium]|nr:DUF2254 domain-containing protein [Burkholderiales bacterium]